MKARELRELSIEELREKEREAKQELFNLRFQKATGQLANTAMLSKMKRDIARVETVLRELSLQGQPDSARV
jgi:large subunit ribosomal protein L29